MPFGPYKNMKHCIRVMSHKKDPPDDPAALCAWLKRKIEGEDPLVLAFINNEEALYGLYLSETKTLKFLTKEKANIILKTPVQIRRDPDAVLVDDHRWLHLWAKALADKKKLFLPREKLEKLHRIYVEEFDRRNLDHQSPLEFGVLQLSMAALQELFESRQPFLVDPEFISVVGSSISSKAEPSDIDILFRSSKSDDFGRQFLESMPEALREDLGLIWEPSGPNGPYLPAYELWALPIKEITPKEPKYKISVLSPFKPPVAEKKLDRESVKDLLENDYFVILTPPQGIRLTIHRGEGQVMAFDEDLDEYSLPKQITEEFLAITEPTSFIVDGFLSKDGGSTFEIIDMPWWRESEHINQTTRTRFEFMFRLPESDHVRFATMHHFENRRDVIAQLKEDTGRYLVVPGSATYSIDNPSDWMLFDGGKMDLAAGSDEKIKGLVDSGKWEEMSADARFSLMTKRKTLEPLYPFAQLKTTKKGYSLREVFGLKSVKGLAKEIFRVPNEQSSEVKVDGFRVQAHRLDDEVRLFTESGHDITKQLPTLVSDMKTLPAKSVIFDSEATPYDKEFHNLGRAGAAPAFVKGAKGPVDDSRWALHIFDILYLDGEDLHNMPYSERRERLKGIELPVREVPKSDADFKIHLWENRVALSTSADQMVKDAGTAAKVADSEGAMFKQWDSKYRLSGNTPLWSKMKVSYDIDAMVVGIKQDGDVFNYICAIGPVTDVEDAENAPLDSAKGKTFVKWKGKIYSVLGKTFNTKTEAKVGQILRVSVKSINKISDKVYHWFHPQVLEAREDKTSPDPLTTAETISKTGLIKKKKSLAAKLLCVLCEAPSSWYFGGGTFCDACMDKIKKGTIKLSEGYMVNGRFGVESPLACCLSSWIAVPSISGWEYHQNNSELPKHLQELGISQIVGTGISRDAITRWAESGIEFIFSTASTILDVYGARPLLMAEPSMPSKATLNSKHVKAFYGAIRSDEVPCMKLSCGTCMPLEKELHLANPLLTYPDESKTWKYVIQYHVRGLSVHSDFRAEISKTQLIGWTWDTGKSLIKPMLRRVKAETLSKVGLTKAQIKDLSISEVSAKLKSTAEGKKLRRQLSLKTQDLSMGQLKTLLNELWAEETEPILKDPNQKILTQRKAVEPHAWLTYSGEVPAGAVGATAEMEGHFVIMDQGTIQFGAQKSYFHEYFIDGKRIKNKRIVIRRLPTRKEWGVKESFAWLTFFTKPGERPYAISNRAVKLEWMPPKRISALPRAVREQIPSDRQYWRAKNAKQIRDALVDELKARKITLKLARGLQFAVKRVWHKGPEVKRGAPVVRYWLLIHDGKEVLDAWDFGQGPDPLKEDGLSARRRSGKDLEDLINTTGELPSTHPVSITKKLVVHHDTSDHGPLQIIADDNHLLRAKFKGNTLKGLYVFLKEDPGSDMWIFKESELPQPKKMLLSSPNIIHLATTGMTTHVIGDVLFISGAAIKPGEILGMDGKPSYFTKEGIRAFWPSMYRQPIVILHGELKGDVIGFVNKHHFDEKLGWGIIDEGIVWHPQGIKLILDQTLPDFSIEVLPEVIWDPEHKHDHVIGGKCVGLGAVPKGACATCHIDEAMIGDLKINPGQVFKFGMSVTSYLNHQYWERGRSTQDLANELGRPRSTVEAWMTKENIPRRSYIESRQLRMIQDEQVRRFGGRAGIVALGTGAFTDICAEEMANSPQCKEAREGGKSKRNYTATLFNIGEEHLLVNAPKGISGMLKIKPTYVLLEHIHEDVIGGLHELRALNPIVFATKDAWDYLRRHYQSLSGEKGRFEDIYPFKRYIIKDKPFKVGPFAVEAVEIEHAKPGDPAALGFKIHMGDTEIWHGSDVFRIPNYKEVLKDVDIFIGDGASLSKGILQNHTSIETQIKWAQEAGIPRIYFTQIGQVGKTHQELNDALRELAPNAEALFDGAEISLGGSAPGAKHTEAVAVDILEGKRTMIVRSKPYAEYAKRAIYLLTEDRVLGLYVEGYPEGPLDAAKVKSEMRDAHGMSDEEWTAQLGDAEKVWVYNPRILKRAEPGKEYEPPKIETAFIHNVKMRDKNV